MSVLGYSFAPFILLAYLGIFIDLKNPIGYSLCAFFVAWSTIAGAKLFEKNMSLAGYVSLEDKRYLIAYPVVLFYIIFMQITIL